MKKTPLYDFHKKLGAKMVEFGGWQMPVSYSSVLKEHEAVRTRAGLFDVSHMGEIVVEGNDALSFLQYLTCNDLSLIQKNQCQYNLLMNPQGGVVDDIIIHKMAEDRFFICVNASNTEKDFNWISSQQKNFDVKITNQSSEYSQIALQGPLAEKILQDFIPRSLKELHYFYFWETKFGESPILLARTGYTGEDGFEIYCKNQDAEKIWTSLLEKGTPLGLSPCGLGCRDTLRLEMAYPLYGHELTDETSPLEANLGWVVKINKGDFIGRNILLEQKEKGLEKKRIGLCMKDPGIARENYPIYFEEEKIGWVTSGTYSPSLDKNIACGYVRNDFTQVGKILAVEIREKKKLAEVVSTPFYKRK